MPSPARTFATIVAASLASFVFVGLFAIQARTVAATMGVLPVPNASQALADAMDDVSYGRSPNKDGLIAATYCSEPVAACNPQNPSGRTSTSLALDDAWFSQDASQYNHDLATSCAVLSAVCNSESRFYSSNGTEAPYAELTLGALGFGHIRTESYALRSTILDQLAALINGSHDVAAYTFASKSLPAASFPDASSPASANSPDTASPNASASSANQALAPNSHFANNTLVFVGIRGSYGAEWISNFDFLDAAQNNGDHRGFKAAEQEVVDALGHYLAEIGADPARTRILITGHSRGGAIGGLLAADLIERAKSPSTFVHANSVYAYTFAAPCSTKAPQRKSNAYASIFNIVNPSDLVPQLPLSIWGYGRYGTTVELPRATSANFDTSLATMQQAYEVNTGLASTYNDDALAALDSFDDRASCTLPTVESLLNPIGALTAAQVLFGIDLELAMASHYPDTYIAWMQAINADALVFSPAA